MNKEKILDTRLGMIAIKKGFATRPQIDEAVKKQQQVFHEKKIHLFIGDVLVSTGIITKEQKEELLSVQKELKDKLNKGKKSDKPQEKENGFNLKVSNDRMEATLSINEKKLPDVTIDDIKDFIQASGIQFGVVEDSRIDEFLKSSPSTDRELVVAKGRAPEKVKKPEIKYYFKAEQSIQKNLGESDTLGNETLKSIIPVKQGDILAEKIECDLPEPGTDIFGKPVMNNGMDNGEFQEGENTEKSPDGLKLFSKIDGIPQMNNQFKINIIPYQKIEDDVGPDTGNVDFDGMVEVKGVIREGFHVKARELVAVGIDKGEVRTSGNILINSGVFGANIHCGGALTTGYIRSSTVDAIENVVVEKEIFDSNIITNGKCLVKDGKVISSQISAKSGIEAMAIGSDTSSACELTVGIDNRIEKDIEAAKKQISAKEEELIHLQTQTPELENAAEENDIKIQEWAAEEGAATTQKVTLERKLDDIKKGSDTDNIEKAEEAVRQLDTKLNEIQDTVEQLFEEQDHIKEKKAAHQHQLSEKEFEIKKLQGQIKYLKESLKTDSGNPVVKVTQEIVSHTEIKGPNAEITTDDSHQGVCITEKKMGQEGTSLRWDMEISSL